MSCARIVGQETHEDSKDEEEPPRAICLRKSRHFALSSPPSLCKSFVHLQRTAPFCASREMYTEAQGHQTSSTLARPCAHRRNSNRNSRTSSSRRPSSRLAPLCALVVFWASLLVSSTLASPSPNSSRRPPAAISTNMIKTPDTTPADGTSLPAHAPAPTTPPASTGSSSAAKPANSTTAGLLFGDRVLQGAHAARRRAAASGSGAGASPASSVLHHHYHHHAPLAHGLKHENLLSVDLDDSNIERPTSVLLAEGPDFIFEFISQCELPTDRGLFNLRAYRYTHKGTKQVVEPVVLFQGDHQGGKDVLVRVHDQCLTSEVLGSRRCDCKEQLELALDRIVGKEGGLIIYLPQEGRGIGLANKVAAYALQEQGLDTVDANLFLGFGDDERTYDYVSYILRDFGIASIRLATNNPFKTRSLRASGVQVDSVEALQAPANRHNLHYLRTKILKMEHSMDLSLGPNGVGSGGSASSLDGTDAATTPEVLTESDKNSTASEKDRLLDQEDVEEDDVVAQAEEARRLAAAAGSAATLATQENECAAGVDKEPPRYCFGKATVEAAVQAMAEGKMVVVVDDEDRENEGDIIMAADACTTEAMAFIVRYCSGVVCVSLEGEELDRLALPPMIANNEDPKHTAFTVSVDYKHGTTTGISAHDRAATLRALADPTSKATDFTRPGHIFPLRYSPGGVRNRRGHTEAALDLSRLAGRRPVGVLCEICNDDGSMARLPELQVFCKKHNLVLTSIADLVAYRAEKEDQKKR